MDRNIEDRIARRIRERFSGGRLERLVTSVLRASGYSVLETRLGPDLGIDIVAGKGDMGFGEPRLCVQVKLGYSPVGLSDYDRLKDRLQDFGANHGLLVSLGGFADAVHRENERSFFEIRLWGPYDLAQKLLDTYDGLPPDVRTKIPIEDRKVLVESET